MAISSSAVAFCPCAQINNARMKPIIVISTYVPPAGCGIYFRFDGGVGMKARRVGLLGFDGVMALDLVGPIDAFSNAFVEDSKGQTASCYEVVIIGLTS